MINHVRTLLLNRGKDGAPRTTFGEEYVPPQFVPKQLSPALRRGLTVLFGSNPDRAFLNYRMRQIMLLIHATELEQFVYSLDPRVTYLPFPASDMFTTGPVTTVTQQAGDATRLFVLGDWAVDEVSGRMEQVWDVEMISSTGGNITTRRGTTTTTPFVVTYSKSLSSPVLLPGSPLSIRFYEPVGFIGGEFSDEFSDEFNVGVAAQTLPRWQIASSSRPTTDFSSVLLSLGRALGEHGMQEIFPPNAVDPVTTFLRIWQTHQLATYRYAALLLAMAWRINTLPQRGL